MFMNEKISVIIPVYNVQEYIGRCLESILQQTYDNFEVICVDDGSSDMSGQICEQYKDKDERIKVVHIENAGVSNARNHALSIIEGSWFSFVDADDWIEPSYLETLYENAIQNNCDVSACYFKRNYQYGLEECNQQSAEVTVFNTSEECIHSFICSTNSMYGMVWNKLYRFELFKDIKFDTNIRVNEDCLYTQNIMEKCSKACLTTAILYHWYQRDDSACHSNKVAFDFTPAEVFYDLYVRNEKLQDVEVSQKLKKNYILSATKVLLRSQYSGKEPKVLQVKGQCKVWRKGVWKLLSKKEKVKLIIVLYLPWLRYLG